MDYRSYSVVTSSYVALEKGDLIWVVLLLLLYTSLLCDFENDFGPEL